MADTLSRRFGAHRLRLASVIFSLALGILIALQIWPMLQEWARDGLFERGERSEESIPEVLKSPGVTPEAIRQAQKDPELLLSGTRTSLSKEPLRLVLTATNPGRNPREGYASIGTDPLNPQIFSAGATLANGAIVSEIYADRVVLERNGQKAVLTLNGREQATETKGSGEILFVGGNTASPVRETVTTSEPITEFIRPVPVYSGDTLTGIEVRPGTRSSAFFRWGLQSGDVITHIDGAPLIDTEQMASLLRPIASGQKVTVTVRRAQATSNIPLDGMLIQEELSRAESESAPEILAGAGR